MPLYPPTSNSSAAVVYCPPTFRAITTAGSGTFNLNYTFIITSGSATVGATYTNNSVTFTVHATVASATQVVMRGSGPPSASGTLTKASGTGDATLTFSQFRPPVCVVVDMVGPGGGGGGTSAFASVNASIGTNGTNPTTFGTQLSCGIGIGGGANAATGSVSGGAGGSATLGSIVNGQVWTGGTGGGNGVSVVTNASSTGGMGGSTMFGGQGTPATLGVNANPARTATGCGGAGASSQASNPGYSGAGGGGGGYLRAYLTGTDITATFAYVVGTKGAGGAAGTNGAAGSDASDGAIFVEERF